MYNKQVLTPLQVLVPQVSELSQHLDGNLLGGFRSVVLMVCSFPHRGDDQLSERIQLILSEQAPPAGSDKAPGYLDGNQVFALAENVLTLFWCLRSVLGGNIGTTRS